ncbi:unannotated protein [freshwater metagenome]|uniref:Unannotated protein n=1 Tax=freshwater metagenome TaxID=449393 RepID=A0A6J6I4G2_9ZZZZ
MHAAVTVASELGGGTGNSSTTEVLDSYDDVFGENLETAFDQDFFGEGVADLHAGALGRTVCIECFRSQDRDAADAVATGFSSEQHDEVAGARCRRKQDVFVLHDSYAQGVDQWVAQVALVEDDLAADVGKTQTVSVATDASHDARQDALGVWCICRTKAQRVHDGDWTSTHGQNVADDSTNTRRGALVGLDVGRVVV